MRFEKHVNLLKEYLECRAYSPDTVSLYTREIKYFIAFIEKHYDRIKEISRITQDIVYDYSNYLSTFKDRKGKPLTAKTRQIKITAIKRFFSFLLKEDYILKDPALAVELPKVEHPLPKNVLTENEVKQILNIPNLRSHIGIRNKAILELFYSCGIRTSELANLKVHDIDLKQQIVTIIKGKGNKTRIVPIGQHCTEYIRLYLEKSRFRMLKGKKDEGFLFLTSRGTCFNRIKLNTCVMGSVRQKAKLDKHISCYSFRHAVATHLIQNKVDIRYVSELLGHSNLTTTEKYCHLDISDLQKMHALCHPREKN